MAFKSFLSAIGHAAKEVWAFISSPAGQRIIATSETVAQVATTAINPGAGALLAGAFALSNTVMAEAIKTEALAAAAAQASGSGPQKYAAVIAAITPQALAFASQHGLVQPTADQIAAMVQASVDFLNSLPAPQPGSVLAPAA